MNELFEIIDNLKQIKSQFENGELRSADIEFFIAKYQARAQQLEDEIWEAVNV